MRMALGAVRRDLLMLVIGGGMRMAAMGIAVGAGALAGSVWLLVRILEVREVGWLPFVCSTGIVAFIAAIASSVPAWRASLLSPIVAIRDGAAARPSKSRRFGRLTST
jgi:ABC-type antimicrobial peptide transport system permease subunit